MDMMLLDRLTRRPGWPALPVALVPAKPALAGARGSVR
jgi:hypothetical protein